MKTAMEMMWLLTSAKVAHPFRPTLSFDDGRATQAAVDHLNSTYRTDHD